MLEILNERLSRFDNEL